MTESSPRLPDDNDPIREELAAQQAQEAAEVYAERYPSPEEVASETSDLTETGPGDETDAKGPITEAELRAAQFESEQMPDKPPVWDRFIDKPKTPQDRRDEISEGAD